jgi:antitoxin VapB
MTPITSRLVAGLAPAVYTIGYTREDGMKTARVFRSGNSQAVRIPKEFRIEGDEVEILKKGRSLVLRLPRRSWTSLVRSLDRFTDDFMAAGRHQGRRQTRGRPFS